MIGAIAGDIGGDSDTLACITSGIAQAFYGGIPKFIEERAMLDEELGKTTREFMESLQSVHRLRKKNSDTSL